MKSIISFIRRAVSGLDKSLIAACLSLSLLSTVLLAGLYSAGFIGSKRTIYMQVVAVGIGLFFIIIVSFFRAEELARLWKLYLPPIVLLMFMTYFMGVQREGSDNRSWLNLFGVSIQPSEFLKIVFILSFAYHLSKVHDDMDNPKKLIPLLMHGAAPVLLILLQKDEGVALIMTTIIVAMLFAAGINKKLVFAGIGALLLGIPVLWKFVMSDYQKERFLVVFDKTLDPMGKGYQQLRGLTAMGSGQLFGNGIFQDNHIYVPENYNDFIFTFLGESLGFIGCFAVIILLMFICGKILHTGLHAKSYTGKYICVGVFAMLAIQSVVNIGMCLMLMPVIGVTLPLLSAGGSSVLSTYAGIGIVMCVYAENKHEMF